MKVKINMQKVIEGGGGTTDHSQLQNLDYEHSGHTGFQPTLVSGQNIKTIDGKSILGNGNIEIEGGSGGTSELSTEVKNAILDCFEHVAWVDEHGQDYYDTLEELFFPSKTLVSISALFVQGSAVIYDNASLDSLKQYLTVTGLYDDESTETITNYSLSGTLSEGISIITVTYQGKTTTFNVNVTAVPTLSSIIAIYTQTGAVYPSDSLNSLKSDLVVKAIYTDASEITLQDSDYTLSGTLSAGTSTITVSYSGKTTTFNVTVSQPVALSSISAEYTQSGTVYTTNTLDSLKNDLVVTANYSDSSTETVNDYTLSGTLTAGTSTITVTYENKTTTFDVTVTAVPTLSSIEATFTQGGNTIYDNATLDSLKQYLVVVATYSDSSTVTLQDSDYTLSGTLSVGTSTITITYENLTDTFDVTVSSNTALITDILTLDGLDNTRSGHNSSTTTWEDLSGNNYDFEKYGANDMAWGDKHAGFGTTTDRTLICEQNILSKITNEITIEYVLSITGEGSMAINNTKRGVLLLGGTMGSYSLRFETVSDNAVRQVIDGGHHDASLTKGTIQYVALSCTTNECKEYINGVLTNTFAISLPLADKTSYYLGGNPPSPDKFLPYVRFNRLSISSRAMSASEIAERYSTFRERFDF